MAQQLGVPAALAESGYDSQRCEVSLWPLKTMHRHGVQTHTQAKQADKTHTKLNKHFLK